MSTACAYVFLPVCVYRLPKRIAFALYLEDIGKTSLYFKTKKTYIRHCGCCHFAETLRTKKTNFIISTQKK